MEIAADVIGEFNMGSTHIDPDRYILLFAYIFIINICLDCLYVYKCKLYRTPCSFFKLYIFSKTWSEMLLNSLQPSLLLSRIPSFKMIRYRIVISTNQKAKTLKEICSKFYFWHCILIKFHPEVEKFFSFKLLLV